MTDTTKFISAGTDPNAWVADTQNLLNDTMSLFGMPVGTPNVNNYIPSGSAPNVAAPLAPSWDPTTSTPLSPPTPSTPLSPLTPSTPLSPLTPSTPQVPLTSLALPAAAPPSDVVTGM